jgi:hypothetical protein
LPIDFLAVIIIFAKNFTIITTMAFTIITLMTIKPVFMAIRHLFVLHLAFNRLPEYFPVSHFSHYYLHSTFVAHFIMIIITIIIDFMVIMPFIKRY